MSGWQIWTWLTVGILGPGAVLVFCLFLRDAAKLLRELTKDKPEL